VERRRDAAAAGGARHGLSVPRGQAAPEVGGQGRFGRLFGSLPRRDPGPEAIAALAELMIARSRTEPGLNNNQILAGFTYLGQFIDHDITFDPSPVLEREVDPDALVNFRTPRLDLDSVYGSGPADQPYLYDWEDPEDPGVRLLVTTRDDADPELAREDLPRNAAGRALIGDARNDEHAIVAQLHLLFLKLHNRMVERLRAEHGLRGEELFEAARRRVRHHFQWVVLHDFLPKVCGRPAPVLAPRRFTGRTPFIPVEFSAAAFRFGHTMVREDYRLNPEVDVAVTLFGSEEDDPDGHLGGRRPLRSRLEIDWDLFFRLPGPPPVRLIPSMRLDPLLVEPLTRVPPDGVELPRRNLERGRALRLPSGQDVARALGEAPLAAADLQLADLASTRAGEALREATPLWYYVLCEADAIGRGEHLGPVGGRIVAEVLTGLVEADQTSYVHAWPPWRPELPAAGEDFAMSDLVAFALGGGP
jgi:hypothetical protein